MKNDIMKGLAIFATGECFLLIHIVSPLIAEHLLKFKIEWSGDVIFSVLSIITIWFIFFSGNKGGKHEK